MDQSLIRNFAIIAHVDHGKSTLADRFLEMTGTVSSRNIQEQTLDSHPISRERGITIRLAPVTMSYSPNNPHIPNIPHVLNLIDTPGHVDFSYEVERSLAACEGAILLVDATQGIQAQTLSHFQKAKKLELKIIPAVNKIDMAIANISGTVAAMMETFAFREEEIYKISAKTGQGVRDLLEAVVNLIPAPKGNVDSPTRALVFSSQYDPERGVTAFVRVVDGKIEQKDKLSFLESGAQTTPFEIGHFTPEMTKSEKLGTGEVGYLITNLRDPSLVRVGDTVSTVNREPSPTINPLPGYRSPQPMVFVSFFPADQNDYALLEDSLKKLKLNDAAVSFSPTASQALGRGWRCGFLGHLHAEISQERLEKDFGLSIIATMPTVEYKLGKFDKLDQYEEPWVSATILVPQDYLGGVITLCEDRRGKLTNMEYHGKTVILSYELPLAEIITDFFDQMKSVSAGYASMDYEFLDYRPFAAAKLEILINHEAIDAFSEILPKEKAEKYGKFLVARLKEIIPRQQIPIALQAAVDGQIIAREDIAAYRKDVTAKLYGGDYTRRLKLLEKQKKGKKKMRSIGKVEIPNDTFLKIFRT